MKRPTNAIAETIVKLEQENWMAKSSIEHFKAILEKNLVSITELEPLATWEDSTDVVPNQSI